MSEFKIEKGIQVPAVEPHRKYPWPEMDDGDSVLIPWNGPDKAAYRNNVTTSAGSWLRRNRPDLRRVTRGEESGLRIWFVSRAAEASAD